MAFSPANLIIICHALIAVTFQQLNQLTCTLNDTSATVITQHNMQPCSDFQVRESRIPPGPSVASTSFSAKKTKKIAASGKSNLGYIRLFRYSGTLTLSLPRSQLE